MKKSIQCQAFSLIEVTIAMGIAAFCLLAIFGLLPVGMNANQFSVNTTRAASLAESLVTDLRNTETGGTSLVYKLTPDTQTKDNVVLLKEDGTVATSQTEASYRASVSISPPAAGTFDPTNVRIVISWPAAATSPENTFEIVTALDRTKL